MRFLLLLFPERIIADGRLQEDLRVNRSVRLAEAA